MEAGNLKCPMCGASVTSDAPNCPHCGTRLAAVSCPSCFAMVFEGARFCSHCGAELNRTVEGAASLPCPRCKDSALSAIRLGSVALHECGGCHGLWIEPGTFESICADRERQASVLGPATGPVRIDGGLIEQTVRYLRCPSCAQLMSRANFAKCSGVIIDVCRAHGTWFDRDELQRIVQFIRSGGLDLAREKEKRDLERERRRLEAARNRTGDIAGPIHSRGYSMDAGEDVIEVVVNVGSSILHHFFDGH